MSQKSTTRIAAIILIVSGLLVYLSSFSGAFVFDDIKAIVANQHIRNLLPLTESMSGPMESAVRDRPLVSLTLAINYALGDLEVWSYHAFNLLIHILTGLTLFGILRRTFLSRRLVARFARQATGLAFASALLWMVHPLQTESVTYIIQRSESLAGLFYLLTLYCFIRGASSSQWGCKYLANPVSYASSRFVGMASDTVAAVGDRGPCHPRSPTAATASRVHQMFTPWLWFGLSFLFCALGMGTKSVMITAPLMVIIYDAVFISGSPRKAFKNHWPFFISLVATGIIQILIILRTDYGDLKSLSPTAYLLTQPGVLLHLIRLSFWPHPLCLDYGWPLAHRIREILPPAILIGALLWATIWGLIKRPALGFLGVWFFLILAPTSTILPLEDPIFEHRLYLSLAAFTTLVVLVAYTLLSRIRSEKQRIFMGCILLAAATIVLGYRTHIRNRIYQNPLVLWQSIVDQRPEHARGHYNLGFELSKSGRREAAIVEYREAIRLKPDYSDAYNNLGAALVEGGNAFEAVRHYGQALRAKPQFWEARYNMGIAFSSLKKYREAKICFQEVIRIQPTFAPAHHRAAEELWKMDQFDQALPYYREAIRLNPAYRETLYNQGVNLANQGKRKAALKLFHTILSIYPDYPPALQATRKLTVDG